MSDHISNLSASLQAQSLSSESPVQPTDISTPNTTPPCLHPTPSTPPHLSQSPSKNAKVSAPFQFGSRYLSDSADPFSFNAWDHVSPPSAYLLHAETQYAMQRASPVSAFDQQRFNADPAKWWNRFYVNNTANFFKDRKWLRQEFPVLEEVTRPDAGPRRVLEIGAGAGNTVFPVLRGNENEHLTIHACDFSAKAIDIMKSSPDFDARYMDAQVWDVTSPSLPPGVPENSIDVVLLVFIFSALSPQEWGQAVRNIYRALKPGGEVCFRDYGRGDLVQVRFRKGRWMEENFYVRGDGTRVYFFSEDELRHIWGGFEAPSVSTEKLPASAADETEANAEAELYHDGHSESVLEPPVPAFEILSLGVDRRMVVNRQKELKMYRCWMQGRFRKPSLINLTTKNP